ncbi:MAG: phosphotransferase [Myxococcaceae bacterium]|nr:phosphotransferase [Myxococcaceae bacterium]
MGITTYPKLVFGTRYPAIPHLAGSAFSEGDVVLSPRQTRAVLSRPFVAYEKLDGLNVGFSFVRGVPRIHSRIHGLLTLDRIGPGLWPMVDFAFDRLGALWRLLGNDLVVYGEWLEGAPMRLPYPRRDVPFVAFDLVHQARRTFLGPQRSHELLSRAGFEVPTPVFRGTVRDVESLWPLTRTSRFGGPAEGLIVVQGQRCFKLVRHDFLERALKAPAAPRRPPLPRAGGRAGSVSKRFGADQRGRQQVEVERLRRVGRLGPGLRSVRGSAVVMGRLGGRRFGRGVSLDEVAAVGRSLSALHRVATALPLDALPDRPSAHLTRALDALGPRHGWALATKKALLPLLRTLERGLVSERVVCHGDLKPEHVRLQDGTARFLDFECALSADAAWELGAAFERLDLDARQRVTLTRAYESEDGTRFLRAWLNRLAWMVVQPVLLRDATLSGSGRRIVARSEVRARALLEALSGVRLPRLSAGEAARGQP